MAKIGEIKFSPLETKKIAFSAEILKFLPIFRHTCLFVGKVRATTLKIWGNFKRFNAILNSEILLNLIRKMNYSRICLIRHHLFRQSVNFSSVPAEFLSFVYISVRLIRHRLIRQFAQFVTSF